MLKNHLASPAMLRRAGIFPRGARVSRHEARRAIQKQIAHSALITGANKFEKQQEKKLDYRINGSYY